MNPTSESHAPIVLVHPDSKARLEILQILGAAGWPCVAGADLESAVRGLTTGGPRPALLVWAEAGSGPGPAPNEQFAALSCGHPLQGASFVALVDPLDTASHVRAAQSQALALIAYPVPRESLLAQITCALRACASPERVPDSQEHTRPRTAAVWPTEPLSGLPTREHFQEQIGSVLDRARRNEEHLAVLCIDLFTGSPDEAPGEFDQTLLSAVNERLRSSLREKDILARLSRIVDEVCIARTDQDQYMVAVELARPHHASAVARRLVDVLRHPFELNQGPARRLYVAIGIALSPSDATQPAELICCAQSAARQARAQGHNDIEYYSPALNAQAFEKLALEGALREAIEKRQLIVHYQPKLEIATERVVGFEALVRWKHPELGLIAPGQFIPMAEETGLIIPIGQYVLEEACRQAGAWQAAGLPPVRMAVNLSFSQFRQRELFDGMMHALEQAKLAPEWLELELTESMLMLETQSAIAILRRLKQRGVHVSIDDFGTGYSSLSYLRRFPIDSLKIDQSFIREINTNPDDAAIATSIILMGRSLKLRVVAEGVETKSQLAFLRVMQCDEAQGFLFSPPVPAERAAEFLKPNYGFGGNGQRRIAAA